jgi:superfamily II RNA helicase
MRYRLPELPAPKLISALRGYTLLPAIVFMPTRRRCDEAALEVASDRQQKTDSERQARRETIFAEFAESHPEVRTHKHRKMLLRAGVASHHAGHIPSWKLVIEKMMSSGLLDAIFATSTVAAGVDFPARTVVVTNADTRGNDGWRSLQASELQQMTGRAGRRGKDKVGFCVLAPSNFQNPPRIASLLKAPPDPLVSQFRATYTSLVNLLDAFKSFEQVRDIAEKSFAFRDTARQVERLGSELQKRLDGIVTRISAAGLRLSANDACGFERLFSAKSRLQDKLPATRAELRIKWLRETVSPGRVVTKGKNHRKFYLVLNVFGDKVMAMREDGTGATLALGQTGKVYFKSYRLDERSLEDAFRDIHEDRNPEIEEPRPNLSAGDETDAVEVIETAMRAIASRAGDEDARTRAESFLWEIMPEADAVESLRLDIAALRDEIWMPFERRARVLDHFGYIDVARHEVTESGKWLADLRVDRPLLAGEAIRRGVFSGLEVKNAAALMASIAADPDRDFGDLYLSEEVLGIITRFDDIIYEVSSVEWKHGVEPAPQMNMSAAAAAEAWAGGIAWPELVRRTGAEEGDLVRLLARTGEALRQIANLSVSQPEAAAIARNAAETVLREPVRQ